MKSILKRVLLAVPVIAFYLTLGFHSFLITGCGSDSTGPGGSPKVTSPNLTLTLTPLNSTDSNGPGGSPKILLTTNGVIPAGSQIVLDCTSPDCKLLSVKVSTDTTGKGGSGPKRIFEGTIPFTIPDNTRLELRIIPRGDPARGDTSHIGN